MNLYILEIITKFIRVLFLTFISIFNINFYSEQIKYVENTILNKDNYAVNRIVVESKQVVYNNKKNDLINKENNKKVENKQINQNKTKKTEEKNITTNTNKKVITKEIIPVVKPKVETEQFVGKLTGYGPDCYGCSGKGNLACKTREKTTHNLYKDGIYYNDLEYGKVRILSAATSKFSCGTIIVVTKPGMEPFTAIVLDTGGDMIKAWKRNEVWMDLAYSSVSKASSDNLVGKNITFSVQRWGW